MGLSCRVLASSLDRIVGVDAVMGYLNRDENRNYHHHELERAVMSSFTDSLTPYLRQAADFEITWADLGRLLRTAVTSKLSGLDGQLLDKYCSHADYAKLADLADASILEYFRVEEFESARLQIAKEIWGDIEIKMFSHVHDVLTGKLDLRICARGKGYCHDLYLIEKNPGKPQKYCSIKCRDAESQRQVRVRRKMEGQQAEIRI